MQQEIVKPRVLKIEVRPNGQKYDFQPRDSRDETPVVIEQVPETLEKMLKLSLDGKFAKLFSKVIFEFFKVPAETEQEVLVTGVSQVEWATFTVPTTKPNQKFESMEISMDMQVNLDEVYGTLIEAALSLNPGSTKVVLEFLTDTSIVPAA